jgi:hypothetical protein
MAHTPRKDLFGRYLGITRGPTGRIHTPNGIQTYQLYLSTALGSTVEQVDIAQFTKVASLTTASTTVSNRGIASVSSAAGTWDLGTPVAGVRKIFVATSTSTLVRTINSTVNIMVPSNPVSTGYPQLALSTGSAITINGQFQYIELQGISTALWYASRVTGYSTAQAAIA